MPQHTLLIGHLNTGNNGEMELELKLGYTQDEVYYGHDRVSELLMVMKG